MTYPEHEKLQQISELSQACGDFLEWLWEQGVFLCEERSNECFRPIGRSRNDLLADYFNIDQNVLEEEKKQMIEEVRSAQQK